MTYLETTEKPEKLLLVSVDTGEGDADESLEELCELTRTAGGIVAGTVRQKRRSIDPATCIGAGKLEEIKEYAKTLDADIVVFDLELSPTQTRNIESATEAVVIDRTTLILDIFAKHARTAEGKLQVEIAQLKYKLPRLTGKGVEMSRLGGGIGTRGPGETKLETDRRYLRERINTLEKRLKELEARRQNMRERRRKDRVICAAIVGYTNAGKSTLLNKLTKADVLAENKLFATLDPTARALRLPDGRSITLIDTVGFIRRLPHKLIDAFKSTLEEVKFADLVINVCDAGSADVKTHKEVTESILKELECTAPIITAYNKCDNEIPALIADENDAVFISALTGKNLDKLLEIISEKIS